MTMTFEEAIDYLLDEFNLSDKYDDVKERQDYTGHPPDMPWIEHPDSKKFAKALQAILDWRKDRQEQLRTEKVETYNALAVDVGHLIEHVQRLEHDRLKEILSLEFRGKPLGEVIAALVDERGGLDRRVTRIENWAGMDPIA